MAEIRGKEEKNKLKPYERQMELAERGKEKMEPKKTIAHLVRVQHVLIRAPDPP